jgi:ribonuclease-3
MTAAGEHSIEALEARLGHRFRNRELILTALTHATAASADRSDYQRLEFLGDRVLGLAVSEMLLEYFPEASEGELSPRFAELVRRDTCADIAISLGLGGAILSGGGKAQQRALQTRNVLGDVCEAVIAAIFLDAGYDAARAFVERNWRDRLARVGTARANAKTALQEWAQAQGLPPPVYTIAQKTGPDHASVFAVDVKVERLPAGRGEGRTRREAEQDAAASVLVREGVWEARG